MGLDLLDLKLIMPEYEQDKPYDIIIVGGGPAGMTAAVYSARKQIRTLLISVDAIGGQLLWTSEIENYMGYQYISGKELTEKFRSQMEQFPIVDIIVGDSVDKLSKADHKFVLTTTNSRTFVGKTVIIASGKRYRPMNAPGEKELVGRGVTYCATCDAPLFAGKDVVVVGGGNSAITAAIDLMGLANAVSVVNIVDKWQADPVLIKKIEGVGNIIPLLLHKVTEIKGQNAVSGVTIESLESNERKDIPVQGVFIEIGLLPNSEFAKDLVMFNRTGEIIVDCAPGIFAAGDVTTVPEKQISVASKAALSAYKYLLMQEEE